MKSQNFYRECTGSPAENARIQIPIDDNTGVDQKEFEKANVELMRIGHMSRMAGASKTLPLIHYYQDGGQSWSGDVMQTCGRTIAAAGCCLCTFAMLERYLGGEDDPGAVNIKMGEAACPFVYAVAAEKYHFTISKSRYEVVSDDEAIDFIIGAIDSAYPVLVGMKRKDGKSDDDGSGTHFVAAYGYEGSTIFINDPAVRRDYKTLDRYLENYCVDRLYVYTD